MMFAIREFAANEAHQHANDSEKGAASSDPL
jgi:hypothetical protein